MTKFVLILALLTPSGLQPWRTLTPTITERECMQIKDYKMVQASYLEDAWLGHKIPGTPVLMCVEYAGKQ